MTDLGTAAGTTATRAVRGNSSAAATTAGSSDFITTRRTTAARGTPAWRARRECGASTRGCRWRSRPGRGAGAATTRRRAAAAPWRLPASWGRATVSPSLRAQSTTITRTVSQVSSSRQRTTTRDSPPGLVCGSNNCRKFGLYYHAKDDCCDYPKEKLVKQGLCFITGIGCK